MKTPKTQKPARLPDALTAVLSALQGDSLGAGIARASAAADRAIVQGLTWENVDRAVEQAATRQNGRHYRTARKGFAEMPAGDTNDHVSNLRAMEMEAAFGVGFVVAARLFGGMR